MSEWVEKTLGDISVDISYGYTESASDQAIGPKFLRITDIQGGVVDWASVPYCPINENDFDKYQLKAGDIVVARTGNSTGENYLFDANIKAVYASYLIKFTINEDVDSKYVWYTMRAPKWWKFIQGNKTGSAQAGANAKTLSNYPVNLPPLPEQKAIAHILGKLDDKIELNRNMNETLEGIAQALFKSWFVDFDPVLDNAIAAGNKIPDALHAKAEQRKAVPDHKKLLHTNPELAAQFPDQFTFNESLNKWIPEGWEVKKLGDRYSVKGGYAFKSRDFVEKDGIPVIKIKSIQADKTIDKSGLSMVETSIAMQRSDYHLKNGDILMAMTGATVGKIGMLVKSDEELIALNQRVAKFYSKSEHTDSIWFVYCFFNEQRNMDFILNTAQGSAQPNISASEIMSAPVAFPPKPIMDSFEIFVDPSFRKIIQNQKETETLTKLRDTLLPQLISGKVRVPEGFGAVAG